MEKPGAGFALATRSSNGFRYYRYLVDGSPLLGTVRTAQRMDHALAQRTAAALASLGHQFIVTPLKDRKLPMNLRKEFPAKFISRDTLPEEGLTATIVSVEYEESNFGGKQVVLTLDNGQRFSLNTTNRKALGRALGDETDTWRGKRISFALGSVTTPNGNTITGVVIEVLRDKPAAEPFIDSKF